MSIIQSICPLRSARETRQSRIRTRRGGDATPDPLPLVRHRHVRPSGVVHNSRRCVYKPHSCVGHSLLPMIRLSVSTIRRPVYYCASQPRAFRAFTSSTPRNMPVSDPNATNASGLSANETKNLKERNPEPHEEKILQGIKEVCINTSCLRCALLIIHCSSILPSPLM